MLCDNTEVSWIPIVLDVRNATPFCRESVETLEMRTDDIVRRQSVAYLESVPRQNSLVTMPTSHKNEPNTKIVSAEGADLD